MDAARKAIRSILESRATSSLKEAWLTPTKTIPVDFGGHEDAALLELHPELVDEIEAKELPWEEYQEAYKDAGEAAFKEAWSLGWVRVEEDGIAFPGRDESYLRRAREYLEGFLTPEDRGVLHIDVWQDPLYSGDVPVKEMLDRDNTLVSLMRRFMKPNRARMW